MMEPTWTAAVLCLLLICCSPTTSAEQFCAKGEYEVRQGHCVPCKRCGDVKVISPCYPTHDTVCADELQSKVFHFSCTQNELSTYSGIDSKAPAAEEEEEEERKKEREGEEEEEEEEEEEKWGLFVEDKITSFRKLTKKDRAKAWRKICHSLKKYWKRTLFSTPHHHPAQCGAGSYQWLSTTTEPDLSSGGLDCRPCSQCPNGSREMSACGGFQDTLCSFGRINNTMELFHMKCTPLGPTLQVYSSRRPSVSQTRLVVIQDRLRRSLCHTIRRTIWKPPVTAAQTEGRLSSNSVLSNHADGGGTKTALTRDDLPHVHSVAAAEGNEKRSRNLTRKHRKKKVSKKSRRGRKNRRHKARSKGRRIKPKGIHQHSAAGIHIDTPIRNLRRRKPSSRRNESDSVTTTKAAPIFSLTTIVPASRSGQLEMTTNYHPTVTGVLFGNALTIINGSDIPEDPELEEEEEGEEDKGGITGGQVAKLSLGLLAVLLLTVISSSVVALFVYRRGKKKRKDYINDSVNALGTEENQSNQSLSRSDVPTQSSVPSLESASHRIIDPLRVNNRRKSHDSGYLTVHSEGSQQGSRSLCRESQSISAVSETPAWTVQDLPRNAVSTWEFASVDDDSPPSPVHDALTLGNKPVSTEARRGRSLSEDCSLSGAGPRRRPRLTPSSVGFSLPPHDLETELQCSRDEGIDTSQESVFCSTSPQDSVNINIPSDEEKSSTADVDSLSYKRSHHETDLNIGGGLPEASRTAQIFYPPGKCTSDDGIAAKHRLNNRGSDGTWDSLFFDDVFGRPQDSTYFPKQRYPSSHSSSSSASSCVSIQLRIPLKNDLSQNIHTDWLHKTKIIGPENVLSSYSCSVMTQTDDWTKTNLRRRPMFCSSWQGCQTFTAAGGTWSLSRSDVILYVPPNAVPSGDSVDTTAATYTNLPHLRQALHLADEEIMVGPLVEFDAGSGFRFQKPVHAFIPHCLPPGVSEDHIKLHHIDKGIDGEFIIRRLPSKREYDLKQQAARDVTLQAAGPLSGRDVTAEDDIGYFEFVPGGQLRVVTERFCGYTCTICSRLIVEPQIHLAVTAKQRLKSRPSGDVPQVCIRLYLWDRIITITDFKRDYLGNEQVGEQILHTIDEFKDSLVKINLTINEEESEQHWKHALRPGSTTPIFPPERSFRLRELLCCHAKDNPRCEEWLAENVQAQTPGAPCYDFQCFIDVANVAHPALLQSQEDAATRDLLEKTVTLFIGDVNNDTGSNSNNDTNNNTVAVGVPKDVLPKGEGTSSGRQSAAKPCQCHLLPRQQFQSVDSNTPYGRMEQGPSRELDFSDVPGWQPLSDEVHLEEPVPRQTGSRRSDPTPLAQQDAGRYWQNHGRSVSCPENVASYTHCAGLAAAGGAAATAEGRPDGGEREAEQGQQARVRAGQLQGHRPQGLQAARDRFDTEPDRGGIYTAVQHNPGQYPEGATAMVKGPLTGEGARPKVILAGTHHQLQQNARAQERPWSRSPQEPVESNPEQRIRSQWMPSNEVRGQNAQQKPTECLREERPHRLVARKNEAGTLLAASGTEDRRGQRYGPLSSAAEETADGSQAETALADSSHNINIMF